MKKLTPRIRHTVFLLLMSCLCSNSDQLFGQMQKLQIGNDHRFLVNEDGSPFVWIGETNWFFAKLPPATLDLILEVRSTQGFTVMSVSCREDLYNGLGGPGSIASPNEAWWSYLDRYIKKADEKNLYVAITLGWWGLAKNNSAEDLFTYGKWVGNRYKDNDNVIWLTLGESGSHKRKETLSDSKIEALVNGIRAGDTGNKLLTIHADYQRGSSISDNGELCDFNNWQTSQWDAPTTLPRASPPIGQGTVWDVIQYDYNKMYDGNPRPTLDSEAKYENNKDFCGSTPFVIRRRAYFTIFAGAFGHTYGAGGIWDGLISRTSCSASALEALRYPGSIQIGYLSKFLHGLKNDFLKLCPDQSIITDGNSEDYDYHIQATLANDKSFALVYSASDSPYTLDLSKLSKKSISSFWYNPRTGQYHTQEKLDLNKETKVQKFDPPGEFGSEKDWVLVVGEMERINHFAFN